jgi:hAT family C-terminal dimerisation region
VSELGNMSSTELKTDVPPEFLEQVAQVATLRAYGPATNRVKVTLVADIHYLATLLDPAVCTSAFSASCLLSAENALRLYFVNSTRVLAESHFEQDRFDILISQVSRYIGCSGSFARGSRHRAGYGASAPNFDPTAWWLMYGGDGKELQIIARHVLGLTPSSCHAERSFSEQKNTHTALRNRLGHETVMRLMFTTWNLRLLNHLDTMVPDFFDDVLSTVHENHDAYEHSGPVE